MFRKLFMRNKIPKLKDRYLSILDIPFSQYDAKTGLPDSLTICETSIQPLVSLEEVDDHLTLLTAFSELRSAVELSKLSEERPQGTLKDFHDLCQDSAKSYTYWVKCVLPFRGVGAEDGLGVDDFPTLEVLMAWHAHMLNPHMYNQDCEGVYAPLKQVGRFPLELVATAIRKGTLSPASTLLDVRGDLSVHGNERDFEVEVEKHNREIGDAIERQAKFVQNMKRIGWLDWERFDEDPKELQKGVMRYHAWLDLMNATECKQFLVPTLDIDLAWHTHQLQGEKYQRDTEKLLGRFLDHNDKAGNGEIGDGFKRTGMLWRERFGYDY